ncbi:hypothetical protein MB901379_03922 [Mycobacterium basiliense]|uniref:Uncharacterized protein n=1 Tax=Mycobacterium basiliense TaxID=2094119 RepID=A0A3S4CYH2_9MYCO|nr:hypothetical protein MB901379_03922 [Mycobacterium basiliense]
MQIAHFENKKTMRPAHGERTGEVVIYTDIK